MSEANEVSETVAVPEGNAAPAATEPVVVEPAVVEPAVIEPAAVEPAVAPVATVTAPAVAPAATVTAPAVAPAPKPADKPTPKPAVDPAVEEKQACLKRLIEASDRAYMDITPSRKELLSALNAGIDAAWAGKIGNTEMSFPGGSPFRSLVSLGREVLSSTRGVQWKDPRGPVWYDEGKQEVAPVTLEDGTVSKPGWGAYLKWLKQLKRDVLTAEKNYAMQNPSAKQAAFLEATQRTMEAVAELRVLRGSKPRQGKNFAPRMILQNPNRPRFQPNSRPYDEDRRQNFRQPRQERQGFSRREPRERQGGFRGEPQERQGFSRGDPQERQGFSRGDPQDRRNFSRGARQNYTQEDDRPRQTYTQEEARPQERQSFTHPDREEGIRLANLENSQERSGFQRQDNRDYNPRQDNRNYNPRPESRQGFNRDRFNSRPFRPPAHGQGYSPFSQANRNWSGQNANSTRAPWE